jgi:hypothetical protein
MHDGCAAGGEAVETGVGRRRVGTVDSRNEKEGIRHGIDGEALCYCWSTMLYLVLLPTVFDAPRPYDCFPKSGSVSTIAAAMVE